MAEISTSAAAKSKPKAVALGAPAFEMPKFEMPKFEMPKFEVPPAFREFAEKGVAQAKEKLREGQESPLSRQQMSSRTPIPPLQKAARATASRLSKPPAPTAMLPSI